MSSKTTQVTPVLGSGTNVKKGSAWVSARASERAVAQQAFAADPKYRKYTQQVEKCLNSFDNVHEWADCIAFLKQLLKTFQSYMQFKEIPRKLVVAKRLSQCLNPALPTGVHQRALDVYAHILAVLGSEGLKRDLPLWSSGLFPFFEYAATSVKPTLLNLYDTHYLPLQEYLRPVMKAFILALLPGLEEETGEFFDKVLGLLDRLSGTVSQSFFLQNIWLVMLTTPSARGTSINYLSRRLPRLNADEDVTSIIGRDVGLMIRAFSAALEDDNLLVRRGALDILLQSMRIDSAAVHKAQAEDRTILMRAATGVVLRRDLSLNRRLYTWLLGPEEKSEHQIAYFHKHSLELLKSTLRDDMFTPTGDYSESRPFKIFISLLDKWEIGSALTDALVYDAFKAVKQSLELNPDSGEDMVMTASTLYEAVEPNVIWKQIFTSVVDGLKGGGAELESLHMALFILKTFPVQDEEIQGIHLPIIFSAIMEILNACVRDDITRAATASTRDCLRLQEEILKSIPFSALLQRPELSGDAQATAAVQGSYAFACTFYEIKSVTTLPVTKSAPAEPFASAFENLIELTLSCERNLLDSRNHGSILREVYNQSLSLVGGLLSRLDKQPRSISVSWNPREWLSIIIGNFGHKSTTFATVDRAIALTIALHSTKRLNPGLSVDERPIMQTIISTLLKYLRSDCAMYHARAVSLIWAVDAATKHGHLEAIVAQSMTSSSLSYTQEPYEAFGVLWRLTEDHLLPGFRFKVPMMLVLDTLKSDNPSLHRVGETWMRSSLKSYIRVLDPILHDLLDPTIHRKPTTTKVHGKELPGFLYERPFDQRLVSHTLDTLLSVVRFGGQGFAKTARNTPIQRSHYPELVKRAEAAGSQPDASYLDVLVDILLRFLQSEPRHEWAATMRSSNSVLQSTSVDLLQALISRGEVDALSVESIEAAVVGKLYLCVHTERLDLQNKLLHLLHSLISASSSVLEQHTNDIRQHQRDGGSDEASSQDHRNGGYAVNPLLTQTLVEGVASRKNRPVLQHWLDFILMALPQFQRTLHAVITPMNDCVCRQLRSALSDILASSADDAGAMDVLSSTTDAELLMFLNALERLVLLGLSNASEANQTDEDNVMSEKPGTENSGLLGYVSNVFGSDTIPQSGEEQLSSRSPGYRSLHEGVRVLYSIWATLAWTEPSTWSPKHESLSLIYNRTRGRCRRVLEHLFRVQGAEVLESIVDCWNREKLDSRALDGAAFDLVDVLIANAQSVVHMLCEAIAFRSPGSLERSRKQAVNPNLSDTVLFNFLEQYFSRLEGPLALQVWGRYLQLVKEIIGSKGDFKAQMFPLLRCLSALADKITQTTAMEDRRVRKELQDNFGKLLDACVSFVGRSPDQGAWIRRNRDTINADGRDSPSLRGDTRIEEKMNGSTVSLQDSLKSTPSADLPLKIIQFIASSAVPSMRKFLLDNDKIATATSNIIYYIVNPALKGKSKPMDVDETIVQIIREMARIPSSLKAWRGPVTDLLNDTRVFNSNPEAADQWKPVVKALFDVDRTAFPELLAKVATAPSANIFTNREYEMLLRSLNLRRLSYVLFTGDKNHFITQLPSIQEKLVDILRNVTAPIVQSEVYLCIRVLLCRLSPHNLTSFWPVILTELYRIFEQIMTSVPSDSSEELQLILSASKVLDMLLVLQTEEFQIHQWIFITDTVDAVYRPDDWFPEAMMDQLAEIIGNLPASEGAPNVVPAQVVPTTPPPTDVRPMRRPLLNSMRQIDSIRDLVPFFSHVSIASYESVYTSGGNVDWAAVEEGIMQDMFDGR